MYVCYGLYFLQRNSFVVNVKSLIPPQGKLFSENGFLRNLNNSFEKYSRLTHSLYKQTTGFVGRDLTHGVLTTRQSGQN